MKIGDKVRLLKGTEEGFIVSIKSNIVEIEIEDGFTIPAVKNEVVVVDQKEREAFNIPDKEEEAVEQKIKQHSIEEGIYLGLEDGESLHCYIVNQTANQILFSLSISEKKNIIGFASGICEVYNAREIGETSFQPMKNEINFIFQCIIHQKKSKVSTSPVEANLTIQKSQLNDRVFIRSLDKSVFLFNVEHIAEIDIDPQKIKEQLIGGGNYKNEKDVTPTKKKEQVIDLHINTERINLPENQILAYQLDLFEKSFDQAILSNASSLKVIHGIGTGKLRNAIHKRISQRKEIRFFEDGDKEKFGFGSTIIYF
jgi:dsDNA-specific endonuclease/ATPase MutS2